MSQRNDNKIKAENVRLITTASVGMGSYVIIGTAFENPIDQIIITSSFDKSVYLSLDGNNAFIFIPANSPPIPIGPFRNPTGQLSFPKGTKVYSFQGPDGVPTSGYLALTTMYGEK